MLHLMLLLAGPGPEGTWSECPTKRLQTLRPDGNPVTFCHQIKPSTRAERSLPAWPGTPRCFRPEVALLLPLPLPSWVE
jgi:hypothetical protein